MRHDFFEFTENNRLACRCGWTAENWTSLERHIKMRTAMDGFIEEPPKKHRWDGDRLHHMVLDETEEQ